MQRKMGHEDRIWGQDGGKLGRNGKIEGADSGWLSFMSRQGTQGR